MLKQIDDGRIWVRLSPGFIILDMQKWDGVYRLVFLSVNQGSAMRYLSPCGEVGGFRNLMRIVSIAILIGKHFSFSCRCYKGV